MAGLQTLMERGTMPGQAGLFSALPAQQGRNPIAYTRALKQTPPEELIRIYNDPNDLRPKWAVASAYADAMKAKALQQGIQGQQAMAQNAAAQQQPPVADEVMTRMAASGGEMKAYADGGAIGFSDAGSVDRLTVFSRLGQAFDEARKAVVAADEELQKFGSLQRARNPQEYEKAKQKQQDAKKAFEDAKRAWETFATPLAPGYGAQTLRVTELDKLEAQSGKNKAASESSAPTNSSISAQATTTPVPAPSGAGGYTVRQISDDNNSAPQSYQGLPALADPGLTPYARRLETDYNKLMTIQGKQGDVSPEVQAARGRLEQMRAGQLEKAREDSEKIWKEGVRQLQRRFDDVKRPLLEDPEALLALAASIDTTKGKVLGSLSAGAAKLLGERRARTEKAEDAFASLNDKIRLLNSQYMEAQALEEQRKLAILTNDAEGKRNAELAMAQKAVDMRKSQADIDYRMRSVDAEREKARATSANADAAREANAVNRLSIALGTRQKLYQESKEEWLNQPNVRLAAMKASSTEAKPEDVNAWRQLQQKFENDFRNNEDIKQQDEAIKRLRQLAGMPNASGFSIRPAPTQTPAAVPPATGSTGPQ